MSISTNTTTYDEAIEDHGPPSQEPHESTHLLPSKTEQRRRLVGQPAYLSTESYSLVLLLISSLFYSLMAANVKLAVATGLPSIELVFLRTVFQGIWVVAAMFYYRPNDDTSYKPVSSSTITEDRPLIYLPFGGPHVRNTVVARGMVGGLGFVLYYYTVSHLPLGDAMTLLSLNPIITVLIAGMVFGRDEPVRGIHVVSALLCIAGCVCIAQPSLLFGSNAAVNDNKSSLYSATAYLTALLGTCCNSLVFILVRRAGNLGVHTLQLLFSWGCFGLLFSTLIGFVLPQLSPSPSPFAMVWPGSSSSSWWYILGTCVFGSCGHLLMNYAGRHAPAGLASILRASGIMWSYGLEILWFDQIPRHWTVLGVVWVLVSLSLIAVDKHRQSSSSSS